MHSHNLANIAVTSACLMSSCVYAVLNKPALRADITEYSPNLARAVQTTPYTVKQWPNNVIADSCRQSAGKVALGPITTYEVTYANCGQPWILCRHADADIELSAIFDVWGRLPVRMRQSVRSALWLPSSVAEHGDSAWTLAADQAYFGGWTDMNVYTHETIHAMDYSGAFQESNLAGSKVWKKAYDDDQAVISEYARTNFVEDLAETGVAALYDTLVAGGAGAIEPNIGRIKHQLGALENQAKNGNYGGDAFNPNPAVQCTVRWPNPMAVSKTKSKSRIKVRDEARHMEEQRVQARANGIQLYNDIPGFKPRAVERTRCQL